MRRGRGQAARWRRGAAISRGLAAAAFFFFCHAGMPRTYAQEIEGALFLLLRFLPEPSYVVVCLGDSITANGYGAPTFPERMQTARPDLTVINEGVAGEQSFDASLRIARVVKRYRPDFMTILYGYNDLFIDRLWTGRARRSPEEVLTYIDAMVKQCHRNDVIPILSTTLPAGSGRVRDRDILRLNQLIRDYAAAQQVDFVDAYTAFWTRDPSGGGLRFLLRDRVHPNPDGLQLLADLFDARIMEIRQRLRVLYQYD